MITCVPLYLHIPVVLALFGVNGLAVFLARRRIYDLEMMLNARRALLHEAPNRMSTVRLDRGVKCDIGGRTVWADKPVTLTIGVP